jgi:nitroreductase
MELNQAIIERRSYRSLDKVEIPDSIIRELAESASLFPSCYNNQPWRFVFVTDRDMLGRMFETLSKGNEWATNASMVIAVCAKKEDDCVIREREYYLFDTGMAVGVMLLKATELGLVLHPIAGYDPHKAKETLGIPEDMMLITLLIGGKHSEEIKPILSDFQREAEKSRPERKPLADIAFKDKFGIPI